MRLIGFDARETFISPSVTWNDARRQTYLLARDARKPYSVDVLVWPSVFGDGVVDEVESETMSRLVSTNAFRGPNSPLWEDLTVLRAALATVSRGEYALVAVSELVPDRVSTTTRATSGLEPSKNPIEVDPSWPLLGYDIADRGLLSALMNCGYSPTEWSRLARRWASRLNDHHLFHDYRDAEQFCAESTKRVPEHAPFFTFELRNVPA